MICFAIVYCCITFVQICYCLAASKSAVCVIVEQKVEKRIADIRDPSHLDQRSVDIFHEIRRAMTIG